jgi:hypothetical protein
LFPRPQKLVDIQMASTSAGLSSTTSTVAGAGIGIPEWIRQYYTDRGVNRALAGATWVTFKWSTSYFTRVATSSELNHALFGIKHHAQLPLLPKGGRKNLLQDPGVKFFLQELLRQKESIEKGYNLGHWSELDHLAGAFTSFTNGLFVQLDNLVDNPAELQQHFDMLFALRDGFQAYEAQDVVGPQISTIVRELTQLPIVQNSGEKMAAMFLKGVPFIASTSDDLKDRLFMTAMVVLRGKKRLGKFVAYGPIASYFTVLQALSECADARSAMRCFQELRTALDDAFKTLDPTHPKVGALALEAMGKTLNIFYGRSPSVEAFDALLEFDAAVHAAGSRGSATPGDFPWGRYGYEDLFPMFEVALDLGPHMVDPVKGLPTVTPIVSVVTPSHVQLTPQKVSSSESWMTYGIPFPKEGHMYAMVFRGLAGAAGAVVSGSAMGVKARGGMQVNARLVPLQKGTPECILYGKLQGVALSGTLCTGKGYNPSTKESPFKEDQMPPAVMSIDDGELIVGSDIPRDDRTVTVWICHPQVPFLDPTAKYITDAGEIITGMDPAKVESSLPWWRITNGTSSFWCVASNGLLGGSRDAKVALLHIPIPATAYSPAEAGGGAGGGAASLRTVREVIAAYRLPPPAAPAAAAAVAAPSAEATERMRELLVQRIMTLKIRPREPKLLAEWLSTSSTRDAEMARLTDELRALSPKKTSPGAAQGGAGGPPPTAVTPPPTAVTPPPPSGGGAKSPSATPVSESKSPSPSGGDSKSPAFDAVLVELFAKHSVSEDAQAKLLEAEMTTAALVKKLTSDQMDKLKLKMGSKIILENYVIPALP